MVRRAVLVSCALVALSSSACGEATGIEELDAVLAELGLGPDPEPEPEPDPEPDAEPDAPPRVPDETDPVIELIGPLEPCLDGEVTFTFRVTDEESDVGIVRAELAGTLLEVVDDGNGDYHATRDTSGLFQGLHTFIVTAIDTSNNLAEDEWVYGKVDDGGYLVAAGFTCGDPPDGGLVDEEPPVVSIVRPTAGALAGDEVVVEVTASDDVGPVAVTASVGDVTVPLLGAAGLYTGTVDLTGAPEGSATITVTATDGADRSSTASVSIAVDHTPPAVSIVEPAAGATVVALTDVIAEATDASGVERVLLLEGETVLAVAVAPTPNDPDRYALFYSLPCAGLPRSTTFEARARDRAGNTASATVAVTVTPDGCQ